MTRGSRPTATIRLADAADAAAVASIYAPAVEAAVISFEEQVPSVQEMRERIEMTLCAWPWLVLEEAGVVLGYAYASKHRDRAAYRWSVDVSVYVGELARGRGIGRALYGALFRVLREQGFHRAFAGVALPNDASVALHRSCGFEPVGVYREVGYKFGAWRDVWWCACPIAPPGTPPREPVLLADVPADTLRGLHVR